MGAAGALRTLETRSLIEDGGTGAPPCRTTPVVPAEPGPGPLDKLPFSLDDVEEVLDASG
jgi:hypothetical protein